ncbi:hypothetical protein QCE49_17070 [Caballeronia sp. LZ008]|uniref:hypothetical protein n=1 Tax=unclassified Caballeronia TaxID=2646786 RepID=UPI0020291040|nr:MULTISPECIES: hypothetical protein [unclassified Caballeronia]MDR5795085.1 hypothetical protein [Caballeronia sp. LZ008]
MVFQNDPVKFKKVGPNKWLANVRPQGLCNSVYLYTMENDPQHTSLWKFSQVRTFADKTGEFCKGIETNYKIEYGWQGGDLAMTCDVISFGF